MNKFRVSLFSKITFSLALLFLGSMFSFAYLILVEQNNNKKIELEKLVHSSAKTLAEGSVDALITHDFELLENWLKAVYLKDLYSYVYLSDTKGRILVHTDSAMIASTTKKIDNLSKSFNRKIINDDKTFTEVVYAIKLGDELFGYAHVAYRPTDDLFAVFDRKDAFIAFIVIFVFLLLMLLATLFIIGLFTKPLSELSQFITQFSFSQENVSHVDKKLSKRPDEIGQLALSFESMTQRLREAYQEIKADKEQLEVKVTERTKDVVEKNRALVEMQDQLIESEKMASLGNLVAGVAHEINTPLGNAVTLATLMDQEFSTLQSLFSHNELSRNDLDTFIHKVADIDLILIESLQKVSLLVSSFKKISTKQRYEKLTVFELNASIKEMVGTLLENLQKHNIKFSYDLDTKDIIMHSYADIIYEIVVSMLNNVVLHGFDEGKGGEVIIKTRSDDNHVQIYFSDNGKGIDEGIKDIIFEPFTTTKRNEGGIGLGLHIIYNLITQHLEGNIKVDDNYTQGSRFIIDIPLKVTATETNSKDSLST